MKGLDDQSDDSEQQIDEFKTDNISTSSNMSTFYKDNDGSWIQLISDIDNIMQLIINSPSNKQFSCCYFGPSTQTHIDLLQIKLTEMLASSNVNYNMSVIGLDTEGNSLQLLQLSSQHSAILVHIKSGLMNSKPLETFLSNHNKHKVIFTGADIVSDALFLPITGLLDLTPIFSVAHPKSSSNTVDDTKVLGSFTDSISPISLKTMYKKVFNETWVKDKAVTCSDWSVGQLTLQQLKYAALDAWVSCILGEYAIEKYAVYGLFQYIFSTEAISRR